MNARPAAPRRESAAFGPVQGLLSLADRTPVSSAELCARLGERHPPTPEQTEVIEAPPGPRAVVAGAGSGKTQTMGLRVVWLVANGMVEPGRVLGLTFTRKAAGELGGRVRRLLRRLLLAHESDPFLSDAVVAELRSGEPTVSTYHSYAAGLVDEHGLRLGLEPGARLLGEAARWQYARDVVSGYDGPMSEVQRTPGTVVLDVLALSGELSEHLAGVADVLTLGRTLRDRAEALPAGVGRRGSGLPPALRELLAACRAREQLLPLVEALTERKQARHTLDFGDQVAWAARLAEECPQIAAQERERYGVVLLDEYQDTGEAQRRLLQTLYGGGWPVVAVGDPRQSIYGWRGASAGNLERFPRDFAGLQGHERAVTPVSGLTVSFRNGERILAVANRIATGIPVRGMAPAGLTAAPGREGSGGVLATLHSDVEAEARWVAARIAALGTDGGADAGGAVAWGEIAVLARKRSALPRIEHELRLRGVPCEVVGLGGLLLEPEIVDVTSVLAVLVDPLAGNALMRVLTGPRWRIGSRDLAALAARARTLVARVSGSRAVDSAGGAAVTAPLGAYDIPAGSPPISIVDALDDLGPAPAYSPAGFARLGALRDELRELRAELGRPLPEVVAAVVRTLRLDVELAARPGVRPADALAGVTTFLDVAEEFAEAARRDGTEARYADGGLAAFLAYLRAAEEQERGLEREVAGDPSADPGGGRVALMTVHAAKGLEWDAVFVVGMCDKVFPVEGQAVTDWTRQAAALPFSLRGDRDDLPSLDLVTWTDQRAAAADVARVQQECKDRGAVEERRLAYVAVTRARHLLACSGFWWDVAATKPRGPSAFLTEVREVVQAAPDADLSSLVGSPSPESLPGGAPAASAATPWVEPPADGDSNPLAERRAAVAWPVDPLGERRPAVEAAAARVRRVAPAAPADSVPSGDTGAPRVAGGERTEPLSWDTEVELLLAERLREQNRRAVVELPGSLSVSGLVALRSNPAALARMLRRPLPTAPAPAARRGTRFHEWLERRWGQQRLLDVEELPGAADDTATADDDLAALQQAFRQSPWNSRRPAEIEFPFELPLGGVLLRGRIDAVFTDDPEGFVDVVDWKTGEVPGQAVSAAAATQLAAYRLAWHAVTGTPLSRIRAAFHYVGANRTVRPPDLPDAEALTRIIEGVPLREGLP